MYSCFKKEKTIYWRKEILISKQRETRISIVHNYTNYNLDIDFIWEVFLSLFNEKEKIVEYYH